MVMPARNPGQVNRLLGGSPPGVPPANAFDMDPDELDRMLSEGWTMFEDGTLAPPAQPGGMNLGAQTGYDDPATGPLLTSGGATPGAPTLASAPDFMGATPAMDPAMAGAAPMPPAPPAPPIPPGPPATGGPSLAGAPNITPPGVPPIEVTPPAPDLGGVASTLPGTPVVSTGVGADRGPSSGLGLERGKPSDFFGDTEEPAPGGPSLDPFAYTQEQNRASLAPPTLGQGDPNGYVGPDVQAHDPTRLLPRRRQRGPVNGPPARLEQRQGIGNIRRPMPPRRP